MSRTLFVGDVHSCAHELGQLLETVQPTRVILLGDVFNKGPDPAGTWELVQHWRAEAVLGNHDVAVIERAAQGELRAPEEAIAWLQDLPLTIEGSDWMAVHGGLNPNGQMPTRQEAINTRRWPDDRDLNNPFWWELYQGERLVLYGHDAMRGLQDHRPRTLGLDTGCVYGNMLTGYILETDTLVRIPAAAVYLATD
jgi:predicted phosphodiesterase